MGGSFGIAAIETTIARRSQFHQSRLIDHLTFTNPDYAAGLRQFATTVFGRGQRQRGRCHAAGPGCHLTGSCSSSLLPRPTRMLTSPGLRLRHFPSGPSFSAKATKPGADKDAGAAA
ncbi:MAG: hypothetical protein WKG07_17565 [Hymenobacter sp.]